LEEVAPKIKESAFITHSNIKDSMGYNIGEYLGITE
jgi:hypothetical protein